MSWLGGAAFPRVWGEGRVWWGGSAVGGDDGAGAFVAGIGLVAGVGLDDDDVDGVSGDRRPGLAGAAGDDHAHEGGHGGGWGWAVAGVGGPSGPAGWRLGGLVREALEAGRGGLAGQELVVPPPFAGPGIDVNGGRLGGDDRRPGGGEGEDNGIGGVTGLL